MTTGTAGVEPAIYRLEGGGIIHYATCPLSARGSAVPFPFNSDIILPFGQIVNLLLLVLLLLLLR